MMWRYDETVNITPETFRTVLRLMEDFPDFTFSQSQASCYRIVEQHDKGLLREIRRRVEAGRWEVAAAAWDEGAEHLSISAEADWLEPGAASACLCSLTEVPGQSLAISGRAIFVPLRAYGLATVRVRMS